MAFKIRIGRHLLLLILCALFFFSMGGTGFCQFFRISGSVPGNGASDVPLDTPIKVYFNQSLAERSIPQDILYEGTTERVIPTSVYYSEDSHMITIVPKVTLKPGTYYIIKLMGIQATTSWILNPWSTSVTFTTKGGKLSVIPYATPSELTLPPGGFSDVTYSFIESGGGLGEIVQSTLIYEDASGRTISKSEEKASIIIRNNQTTKFHASISIPKEVGQYAQGQTITVRRIFTGLDHDGNRLQLRTGVKVNLISAMLSNLKLSEISINVPEFGMLVPKDSIIPAEASIKGTGSGDIHGSWTLDGEPKSFFVATMVNGGTVKVTAGEKAFAELEGRHTLSIQIITPEKLKTEDVIYIVCSTPSPKPVLLKPDTNSSFSSLTGTPPRFRWSSIPAAIGYRIAVGKSQDLKGAEWIPVETNSWTPDWNRWSTLGKGTFYWAVKPILYNKQEGPLSDVSTFTLSAPP